MTNPRLASGRSLLSRRQFIVRSASAGAAILGAPAVLRAKGLNEKLNVALIGVGNKGEANRKGVAGENIVALCDVDRNFLNKAVVEHPGARAYRDWRKMLEQKDIDAVVVTTPDHMHAVASIAAMKLGKHVYCEKPLTHSIYEARRMAETAREYKVATQMGNGGHSGEGIRQLVEWVQAGIIGQVKEVHAWSNRPIWPQGITRPVETPPVPEHLDWDLWLGPAPERPYHPAYHPFKWRGWWDFGTGALGDMGCHIIDAAFWALGLTAPIWVEAESSGANNETAPSWSIVRYEFPAGGQPSPVKVFWYDGGKTPGPELTELPVGEKLAENGSLFIGQKGKIIYDRNKPRLIPQTPPDFQAPLPTIPRSIGHYAEWIAACKGNGKAGSNFDYAGPLTEAVLLGNISLRLGKKIEWDSAALKVTNAPEAAALVRREYRRGWSLS